MTGVRPVVLGIGFLEYSQQLSVLTMPRVVLLAIFIIGFINRFYVYDKG